MQLSTTLAALFLTLCTTDAPGDRNTALANPGSRIRAPLDGWQLITYGPRA